MKPHALFLKLASVIAMAGFFVTAQAQAPTKVSNGVLTNAKGMTLYTTDRDEANSGKSICNGPCTKAWPPLEASASDKPQGDYTVLTREDGGKQWAYKGKPLYQWSKDKKPGDKTGDGVNDVWHVARP